LCKCLGTEKQWALLWRCDMFNYSLRYDHQKISLTWSKLHLISLISFTVWHTEAGKVWLKRNCIRIGILRYVEYHLIMMLFRPLYLLYVYFCAYVAHVVSLKIVHSVIYRRGSLTEAQLHSNREFCNSSGICWNCYLLIYLLTYLLS